MEKKTLYWIRGSKKNPEGVKKALKAKGIQIWPETVCDCSDYIYYGVEGHTADSTRLTSTIIILSQCGTELKPIVEETFKPFDKVIVRDDGEEWNIDFFNRMGNPSDVLPYKGMRTQWKECHLYEDWMAKYLGTDTPFEEFRKEGNE